jgi:acetyl-CoA carboxylase alpha subunit
MSQMIQHELATLVRIDRAERRTQRLDRYRRLGTMGGHERATSG